MKLELSDEQRYVLELALDDQIDALDRRIADRHNRFPKYAGGDGLPRHRDILDRLLVELRFPL